MGGLGHTKHRRGGNDHEKARKFIYQQTGNREKTCFLPEKG
jgi:hypothetical protein